MMRSNRRNWRRRRKMRRIVCCSGKHRSRLFHVVGHGLEALHDRQIAIDDEIEHRMEHVVGAFGQPLGIGFQRAQADMRAVRPEPHRDDEIGARGKRRSGHKTSVSSGSSVAVRATTNRCFWYCPPWASAAD
jgi:hypothetical protein